MGPSPNFRVQRIGGETLLLRGSEAAERRTLVIIGIAVATCAVVFGTLVVVDPFASRPTGTISIAVDVPYVGQGVTEGTEVIMHGVAVGRVAAVMNMPGGGVEVAADFDQAAVAGLTTTMSVDFRPINYFGVTGMNLIAGAGGQPLRDGMHIITTPKGNFTLQALLSRLGEVSAGALTPQLVQVIDRATRYTDALVPLIEAAFIATNTLARVQTISTAQLLANAAGLSAVIPSTVNTLTDTGFGLIHNDLNWNHKTTADVSDDEFKNRYLTTLEDTANGVFADVGRLESTHTGDLLSVVGMVKSVMDVVPPLIRPEGFAQMLGDLRSRFEKMYAGPPGQRALNVRIALDSLPGVAAPVNAIGGP